MVATSQTIEEIDDFCKTEVRIDPRRITGKIDPRIYSGFLEHLGRCIYGGIVELETPFKNLVNEQGYRLDVASALQEMQMPIIRWPGGNFVSSYHWTDGIGKKEDRPRRPELAWLSEEPNQFGTDEFLHWCEWMKVEPYICLNMGTGSLDEALGWIEYCNSNANTFWANLRRKNGREEPYNVKYWGLGNEVWGPWQVGQMNEEDYCKKATQWAKAIKLLDPSVKLISCGNNGFSTWDSTVTRELFQWVDLHSIHLYTADVRDKQKNLIVTSAVEVAIESAAKLIDLAKIANFEFTKSSSVSGQVDENKKRHHVEICFDEWNVWDPERAGGSVGCEEKYTLGDAVAVSSWLNAFVRQANNLSMANIAQCVNVIAPIMTKMDGMFFQTTYYPFVLFSQKMRGESLNIHITSPLYKGDTDFGGSNKDWLGDVEKKIPFLDSSASINGNKIVISISNRSIENDAITKLHLAVDFKKVIENKTWRLSHDDIDAINTFENPDNVKVLEGSLTNFSKDDFGTLATLEVKRHSFMMIEITIEE